MDATQDSGLRILLVEDDEALLEAFGSLLKVIGHSVIEAREVSEALSLFESRTIDLLISDINLRNGSGLELIRQVRQTSEIPAIAMSGEPDMSGPSLAGGFSAFLAKPVSKLCLQQTIGLVVSERPVPELGSEALTSGPRLRGLIRADRVSVPGIRPLPCGSGLLDEPEASGRRTWFSDSIQDPTAGRE
jgi:CheY-like chemotaxis protein